MADIEAAVARYIELRDMKERIEREHKDQLVPYNEGMRRLEAYLHKHLLHSNIESMKTEAGTAFLQQVNSITVKDRSAWLEFLVDNDAFELADIRAAKSAVLDYIESQDEVPPGLKYTPEKVCRVRR